VSRSDHDTFGLFLVLESFRHSFQTAVNKTLTLRSALQDLRETTLAAISGLLAKLTYIASLRRSEGGYSHWGMSLLHGEESSARALKTAHTQVLSSVLKTPLADLEEDLHRSSEVSGKSAQAYVEDMRGQINDLLPSAEDSVSATHLNSVLVALSSLEKSQKPATPSTSSQLPQPGQ
jgi:hypothetical protein